VVGELDKTSQDFDRLIHGGTFGFNDDHPVTIDQAGKRKPGASSKTIIQILDDLQEKITITFTTRTFHCKIKFEILL
jgi:hypothetical protein